MHSHAQLPVADWRDGNVLRVYFASRDRRKRSHVGWVDFDIRDPKKILGVSDKPVLEPGPIGFFDEHGVFPSCIVNHGGQKYLYYIGWNRGYRRPLFYASIGLAVSGDGGKSFVKYSRAPLLSRSEHDPCLVTSPFVYIEDGVWRMLYTSGIKWGVSGRNLVPYYHVKIAESDDGITWRREGRVALDLTSDDESSIARPWILQDGNSYHAWYCFARGGQKYRIGYAESKDAIHWERKDREAGIRVSARGFDSEMLAYPCVICCEGKKYMFYNGNAFGEEGFGLAVAE